MVGPFLPGLLNPDLLQPGETELCDYIKAPSENVDASWLFSAKQQREKTAWRLRRNTQRSCLDFNKRSLQQSFHSGLERIDLPVCHFSTSLALFSGRGYIYTVSSASLPLSHCCLWLQPMEPICWFREEAASTGRSFCEVARKNEKSG